MSLFLEWMRKHADISMASDTLGSQVTGANDNPMRDVNKNKPLQPWMDLQSTSDDPEEHADPRKSTAKDVKGEGTDNGGVIG
jgi:hypothetical protein